MVPLMVTEDYNERAKKHEGDIANFLVTNNLRFEQHKKILGFGDKQWIVDFYLQDQGIIIEAKTLTFIQNKPHAVILGASGQMTIYKDLYKLCELQQAYNLTPILFLRLPNPTLLPKAFINNLSAHGIFYITQVEQIITVIQSHDISLNNTLHSCKSKQPTITDIADSKWNEVAARMVKAYGDGVTLQTIGRTEGLHVTQVKRAIQTYIKRHVNVQN
jgi:hypothetical protein